jgi:hypothetical protein
MSPIHFVTRSTGFFIAFSIPKQYPDLVSAISLAESPKKISPGINRSWNGTAQGTPKNEYAKSPLLGRHDNACRYWRNIALSP